MRRIAGWLIAALTGLGCSSESGSDTRAPTNEGDGVPEQPQQLDPAEVIVISVEQRHVDLGNELVTVHLKNTGGPGVYKLEFWGLPHLAKEPETFYGETEPVDVPAGHEHTSSWEVPTKSFPSLGLTAVDAGTRPEDSLPVPLRTVNVTTAAELKAAIESATPGDYANGIFVVQWILVFTRDQGGAEYRQTARFDFPDQ
jgi:hypothetical protein